MSDSQRDQASQEKRSQPESSKAGNENIPFQLFAVRLILTLALVSGVVISWKLWHSEGRAYPVLPMEPFPRLAAWVELVLLGSLGCALGGMFFLRQRHYLLAGSAVVLLGFLAACDQTRWQPWVYQYWLSLIPFIWLRTAQSRQPMGSAALILKSQRLILIAVYFWAGYHKLGSNFHGVWVENFVAPLQGHLSEGMLEMISEASRFVAPMEIAIAILLIFSRTRWLGIVLACLMHLSILILIGPLMGNINEVIWPWNLCMMALVIVLFAPKKRVPAIASWSLAKNGQRVTFALIAFFVCLMPSFSEKGQWDRYLSFHLYSGKGHRYSLILFPSGFKKLPEEYHPYLVGEPSQVPELNASAWALKELKVPPVSEDRVMLLWCRAIMEMDFQDRDCFIHHDIVQDESKGVARYRPSQVRQMKKIPALPGPTQTR